MEFSCIADVKVEPEQLQDALSIARLPEFCDAIYESMRDEGNTGEINCIWGVFIINREVIRGGLRFTLPACPNTVAWTVTTGLPPELDVVDVHCSIRRREPDPDFQDSINEFMDDWKAGLERQLSV